MKNEANEGTVFKGKVWKIGGSLLVTIPPSVAKYMGVEEGSPVALKCEKGKYGPYIGIGKLQVEGAMEAEEKQEA